MQALTESTVLENGDTVNFKTDTDQGGFIVLEIIHGQATISSKISPIKAQELLQKLYAVEATARVG